MAIGTHQPKTAMNHCWKDSLAILIDETTTALQESITGLTDEQLWARPMPDRHAIGTIVMHCLESLNSWACWAQTGKTVRTGVDEGPFEIGDRSAEEVAKGQQGVSLPTGEQLAGWIREVRGLALEGLEQASEADLCGLRGVPDWFRRTGRLAGDAYMRCLCHVAAHVRQIWCLRGAMNAFGGPAWPRQQYA